MRKCQEVFCGILKFLRRGKMRGGRIRLHFTFEFLAPHKTVDTPVLKLGRRIRSPAGEPRRLQVSTGHLLRAAFRIRPQHKKSNLHGRSSRSIQTDSLFCGKATAVASVHRTLAKSRLSNPLPDKIKSRTPDGVQLFMVGEGGFEPPKR